jgi:hypothetical protein
MMERASVSAAKLIQELTALAQRLAERDIVVPHFHCEWGRFGYWAIWAQSGVATEKYHQGLRGPDPIQAIGPEVFKCTWDNRDQHLVISRSPTRPLCSPNEWTLESDRPSYSNDEAMGLAETFLVEKLALPSSQAPAANPLKP